MARESPPRREVDFSIRPHQTPVGIEGPKSSARFEMKAGERFFVQSAGGGGYGDPAKRDSGAVAHDLAEGYVTKET